MHDGMTPEQAASIAAVNVSKNGRRPRPGRRSYYAEILKVAEAHRG